MKAIVHTKYGPPEVLKLKEIEKPVPKENEVLVRIKATTVTQVDCTFRKGDAYFARLYTGIIAPKNPVLGSELSGEIEAVGEHVTRFNTGDRVFGTGSSTHAEYICLPADGSIEKIPEHFSFEQAATIPYGSLTALPFLRDTGRIQRGQKVLINGASGSVGTYAVQLAKYFGAEVTGVCSTSNVELVQSIGADRVIDYKKEDFTEADSQWDIIFDAVGKSSFGSCKRALTEKGIYLTTVASLAILFQKLWTAKSAGRKADIAFTGLRPPDKIAEDLSFIRELLEKETIRPVIDRSYPLEKMVDAHRYVETGHKTGNVIIRVG